MKCYTCGDEVGYHKYHDKILNICLDAKCAKKYIYRESRDKYGEKYYNNNRIVINRRRKEYRLHNHSLILQQKRRYRETHQEVIKRNKTRYIVFKDRRIALPYKPRTGECSSCHRRVDKGEIKVTNMHHFIYDENDPGAYTEELCVKCHNNRR